MQVKSERYARLHIFIMAPKFRVNVAVRNGGRGERGTPGERDKHACPAAQRVWRGYEWMRPLQEAALFCDRETTGLQQRLMEENRADGTKCVYLALLAFLRAGEEIEFFRTVQWGPVPQERLGHVFGMYCRAYGTTICVFTLTAQGGLEAQMTIGRGGHTRNVVLVPSGDGGLHCLPFGKIRAGAAITLPPVVLSEMRGGEESAPTVVVPTEAEASSPAIVVAEPPVPATMPRAQGVSGGDLPEFPDPWEGSLVEAADTHITLGTAAVTQAMDLALPDWVPVDSSAEQPHPSGVLHQVYDCHDMDYRGIQKPPKCLQGIGWRGGWFPSQCPEQPAVLTAAVKNKLFDVEYASATLDNFELFGTYPLYVPVRLEGGLTIAGRRTITDGKSSVEFFTPGDTLVLAGSTWSVQEELGGFLRVVATNVRASVRGAQPFAKFRQGVCVQAAVNPLSQEGRAKALWQLVCLENDKPTETAILSRMRGDEAQNGYKGVDAESAADLVRVLASRYRTAGNVAGPFSWGHCYSCGGPLKGKMKQRICCPKVNTDLAKMVAEGCKVTSHATPIRYPGVVWTQADHPPLKPGVETVATRENFPMPRRSLRLCRPRPRVMARDWEEWGSTGLSRS